MIELLIGLAIGAGVTYKYVHDRVEDYKFFSERRVQDFKDAFDKGYQTQNHVKPFYQEKESIEDEVPVQTNFEHDIFGIEYEDVEPKRERWDD